MKDKKDGLPKSQSNIFKLSDYKQNRDCPESVETPHAALFPEQSMWEWKGCRARKNRWVN